MVENLNPTTQVMFIFQSQDFQKNIYNKIMGGIISSLVDNVTSMVMMSSEEIPIPSVTIYLNCDYFDSIEVGERCFVLCELKKVTQMSSDLRKFLQDSSSSNKSNASRSDSLSMDPESKFTLAFRGNDNDIEICEARIFNESGKLCYFGNHAKMYPRGL